MHLPLFPFLNASFCYSYFILASSLEVGGNTGVDNLSSSFLVSSPSGSGGSSGSDGEF